MQSSIALLDTQGLPFRLALNEALLTLITQNAGPAEPSTTYAFQWWADTNTGILKQRNAANNDWIDVLHLATGQPVNASMTVDAVPTSYAGDELTVTQPHLRKMVWSAAQAKYIRAPWHQPCQLFFSYDNPSTIPGALPVRGDAAWNQVDFPDVVERLGLSGAGTFSLVEARGEGIRVLDNGRGVDVGRALHSAQGDAMRNITGSIAGSTYWPVGAGSGALKQGASSVSIYQGTFTGGARSGFSLDLTGTDIPLASEIRMRNISFPLWMTI